MDNAQKAIMIGVGLFITIIVISAVMLITGVAQDLLNEGQNKLGNLSGNLQNQLLNQYDQKTMSGSVVLSAIKSFYTEEELVVLLYNQTGGGTAQTVSTNAISGATYTLNGTGKDVTHVTVAGAGNLVSNTAQPALPEFSNRNSATSYIKPSARYKAVLVQTANNVVLGVAFVKYGN